MHWPALAFIPLSGALLAVVLAVLTWRRRTQPAARYLVLMALGLAEWSLAGGLGLIPTHPDVQVASTLAIYPGAAAAVLGFYLFARSVADPRFRPSSRTMMLLCVEPVLVTVAAATNPLHGLLLSSTALTGSPAHVVFTAAAGFWLHAIYSYLLLVRGAAALLATWRSGSVMHRRRIAMILIGTTPLVIANVVTLVRLLGGGTPDYSVIGIAIWLPIFFVAMRTGLLRIVPLARAMVLDRMSDAVVVVGVDGQVLDVNQAARELATRLAPEHASDLGRTFGAILAGEAGDAAPGREQVIASGERSLVVRGHRIDLSTLVTELTDSRGFAIGRVYVVRDVTQLNEQRRELIAANGMLKAQVATIEGLRVELADLAIHDELTGLLNRRHLRAALAEALASADADGGGGGEITLAMVDVDFFKRVNDQYGHSAGDDLLVAIARTLEASVRPCDVVVRYGGEEFVVLLLGMSPGDAWLRADQLRAACALTAISIAGDLVSTTISVGIASRSPMGASAEELLRSADSALYRAKGAGRDCVVAAGTG